MTESQERINGFLESLEFKKKRFGGVDPQDVLDKFSELDKLYATAFAEKMKDSKARIIKLSEELEEREREAKQLSEEQEKTQKRFDDVLKEREEREKELVSANIKCKELNEAKEILEKENLDLNERIALLSAPEKKSADGQETIDLLRKSNAELNENKIQLERKIAELQQQIVFLKEEKQDDSDVCADESLNDLLENFREQQIQNNLAKKEDILFSTQKMLDTLKKSNFELNDVRRQLENCIDGLVLQLENIQKDDVNDIGECFEESFKKSIIKYKNQIIKKTEAENEQFLENTQKKVDSILSEARKEIDRLRNDRFTETEKAQHPLDQMQDHLQPEVPTTFDNKDTVYSLKSTNAFWRAGLKT